MEFIPPSSFLSLVVTLLHPRPINRNHFQPVHVFEFRPFEPIKSNRARSMRIQKKKTSTRSFQINKIIKKERERKSIVSHALGLLLFADTQLQWPDTVTIHQSGPPYVGDSLEKRFDPARFLYRRPCPILPRDAPFVPADVSAYCCVYTTESSSHGTIPSSSSSSSSFSADSIAESGPSGIFIRAGRGFAHRYYLASFRLV